MKHVRISPLVRLTILPLAAAALAACSEASGGDAPQSVALSFAGSTNASALVPIEGDGHVIELESVDVVFTEIVLERAENGIDDGDSENDYDSDMDSDGDSEADSDSDGPWNEHFRAGAVTVGLPLEGGVITPITTRIPFGTYEELELDIGTVRLRGTYDGLPFDVTLLVDEELEARLDPLFVVDDESDQLNLTIAFDVADWLRNPDGTLIDPFELAADPALRALVVSRIEASFDAFEDSDRDADDADSDSDSD